jgi:hypothetical protein
MRRVDTPKTLQIAALVMIALLNAPQAARADNTSCALKQSDEAMLACAAASLDMLIPQINNARWRDQSFREQAKILIRQGSAAKAIELITQISNEDTQALTIRAIGVAMADLSLDADILNAHFDTLHAQAMAITHTGSQDIALTYIAIAESSAGLFERALTTAQTLKTVSLRNKSYQEIAEILSVKGDVENSFKALQLIDDAAFQNKAYGIVAGLLIKHKQLPAALKAAEHIQDPYIKANTVLNIINAAE